MVVNGVFGKKKDLMKHEILKKNMPNKNNSTVVFLTFIILNVFI